MFLLPLLLLALLLHALCLGPLAPALSPSSSTRVLDRGGLVLAEVRDERYELASPVPRAELSPWLEPALLAAEDSRFHWHPGIDPLALLRAAGQALWHGRIVSGGSTITQQLARTLFERPRTLAGKWRELAYAIRLEAELDKSEILQAYLDRVAFGPRLRGVGAASRWYFDKPASALSLGEAAALAALVQAPSRLDPARHPERLGERRDRVLARLAALGLADAEAVERARRTPLGLRRGHVLPGGYHFVRAAVSGRLGSSSADAARAPALLETTLDGRLQREVERLVLGASARFADFRASAASVLVVDTASAEVLAYVGAPDPHALEALGQNDGVLALRQPGSTLKPFVYALGMMDLGLHAASLLPDLERRFVSPRGQFLPHNYDRRFHGPVRLAQALASSLNVPAVELAEQLGAERLLATLKALGFSHLDQPAVFYGPGLALGVGEVQLAELAAAYATLGRGGSFQPLRYFRSQPRVAPQRVLSEAAARSVLAILSDPRERAATFGRDGPLELERPVAVKTGTSKGNRDNWVIGTTSERTVAVWVGNFDGSPMLRSSGASGAGPLFHAVMAAALRGAPVAPAGQSFGDEPAAVSVCAESGSIAGPACPHRLSLSGGSAPRETCSWHRERCAAEPGAPCRPIETLPARYAAWAQASGRAPPLASEHGTSPSDKALHAEAREPRGGPAPLRILVPGAGQRFSIDPRVSRAQQELVLRAEAEPGQRVRFEVDGAVVCEVDVPLSCPWPLAVGLHRLEVSAGGTRRSRSFRVE
jgi:penicillin-binding protein 1C